MRVLNKGAQSFFRCYTRQEKCNNINEKRKCHLKTQLHVPRMDYIKYIQSFTFSQFLIEIDIKNILINVETENLHRISVINRFMGLEGDLFKNVI